MASNSELTCTLLGDGSTDRVLEYPIRWSLHDLCPDVAMQFEWADLSRVPKRPQGLTERISVALKLYPAQILFVHRDAERENRLERVKEIEAAARSVPDDSLPPFVCVVPVRMTEAWLIIDESAIRQAAGNPCGSMPLGLPSLRGIESNPDPKSVLKKLLVKASGYGARRRNRFRPGPAVYRLARLIEDYTPLRDLPAFCAFEADLRQKLTDGGWLGGRSAL